MVQTALASTDESDVVIVGGGPCGLMLACELRLNGLSPVLIDRLPSRSRAAKANGLVGQVVRVMDYRGLYEPHVPGSGLSGWLRRRAYGRRPKPAPRFMFGGFQLDLRRLRAHPLAVMPIPQARLEELLEQRANDLGAEIRRDHDLLGFTSDPTGVNLDVEGPAGPYRMRARYLVGCDGAHSTVRKLAGIDLVGTTRTNVVSRNGHVVLPNSVLVRRTGELRLPGLGRFRPFVFHRTAQGVFSFASFGGPHLVSTYAWDEPPIDGDVPMSVAELRDSMRHVLGQDLPMTAPPPVAPAADAGRYVLRRVTSRNDRVARQYRSDRVLLVGDAAHVVTGFGGPGLNLGLQDAVNLGWKLAAEVRGRAPADLLDSYDAERRPIAERAVEQIAEQLALMAPGAVVDARRRAFARYIADSQSLRHIVETVAGADLGYAMPDQDHPLAGRMAPDIRLTVAGRRTRLAVLLRAGRPVLLDPGGRLSFVAGPWRDRVDIVRTGRRRGVSGMLIRPDGYVAWAAGDAERTDGLRAALSTWFGPGLADIVDSR